MESGKVVSSPSRAQGKAPTENGFGYFTAVKYCTGGNYIDDSYHLMCMFYTTIRLATANRSCVSIRVEELFGQGRWRGRPLSNRLQFDRHAKFGYCFSFVVRLC